MSFQTYMNYFLLWNKKINNILKKVSTLLVQMKGMNMSETILNLTDFYCIDNCVKVIQGQSVKRVSY